MKNESPLYQPSGSIPRLDEGGNEENVVRGEIVNHATLTLVIIEWRSEIIRCCKTR